MTAHPDKPETPESPLRYRWRRTWEDQPRDFVCIGDDGEPVGRIYYTVETVNNPAHWQWFLNGEYRGYHLNPSGREPGRLAAARAVEDAYEKAKARIDAMIANGEPSS